MIFHQRNYTVVIGAIRKMEVSFVHKNHCRTLRVCDEFAQLIFGRNACGGIIRVADVNQTSLRSGTHFWKIMGKGWSQWNLYHLGAVNSGLLENCFESRIGYDEWSALFPGECLRAELQNLAGPVAEQDLVAIDVVQLRQLLNEHVIMLIGVTAAEIERTVHCRVRF